MLRPDPPAYIEMLPMLLLPRIGLSLVWLITSRAALPRITTLGALSIYWLLYMYILEYCGLVWCGIWCVFGNIIYIIEFELITSNSSI